MIQIATQDIIEYLFCIFTEHTGGNCAKFGWISHVSSIIMKPFTLCVFVLVVVYVVVELLLLSGLAFLL